MAATSLQTLNPQSAKKFFFALGFRGDGSMPAGQLNSAAIKVSVGGAPADNTAATDPTAAGVLCLDLDNMDVYICTAYTNSTTHTWTKIAGVA